MPYIPPKRRDEIIESGVAETPGELNFVMTHFAIEYVIAQPRVDYDTLSDVVKTFECAKLEFVRRVLDHYEDEAMKKNGDVYQPLFDDLGKRRGLNE